MDKVRKAKKKSMMKIVALCLVLSLGCSISVSAASNEIAKAYEELVDETRVDIEMPAMEIVYGEVFTDNGPEEGITIEEGEVNTSTRGTSASFQWTVNSYSMKHTANFYCSVGDVIYVTSFINPTDKTVKVGVINPNGTRQYVLGSGSIFGQFTAQTSGEYMLFVENTNSVAVTASGGYEVQ